MSAFDRLRRDYAPATALDFEDLADDPLTQFTAWLSEAVAAGLSEPNAMTLATVGADGQPSARIVLLKDLDGEGLVFFTNYHSRKGRELAANPKAALVFWWPPLSRQVRFEGRVEPIAAADSDAYFASRPRGSQLGAAASPQSTVIADRAALEAQVAALSEASGDGPIARPAHWGGYRLVPRAVEFWQGRPDRLHDRFRYDLAAEDESNDRNASGEAPGAVPASSPLAVPTRWRIVRLAP